METYLRSQQQQQDQRKQRQRQVHGWLFQVKVQVILILLLLQTHFIFWNPPSLVNAFPTKSTLTWTSNIHSTTSYYYTLKQGFPFDTSNSNVILRRPLFLSLPRKNSLHIHNMSSSNHNNHNHNNAFRSSYSSQRNDLYEHHISSTHLKMRSNANVNANVNTNINTNINTNANHKNNKKSNTPYNHSRTGTQLHAHSPHNHSNNNSNHNSNNNIVTFITGHPNSKRRKAAKSILSALTSLSFNTNNNNNTNNDTSSSPSSPSSPSPPPSSSSSSSPPSKSEIKISILKQENDILKQTIHQLTLENDLLKNTTLQLRHDVITVSNSNKQTRDELVKMKQLQQLQQQQKKIVIEQFEGEGVPVLNSFGEIVAPPTWWEDNNNNSNNVKINGDYTTLINGDEEGGLGVGGLPVGQTTSFEIPQELQYTQDDEESCEDYPDGVCPIEPHLSFQDALRDRAYWLVGLLTLQSMSGFILQRNEELLQSHPIIVYFLTMLVGAGGNAGNQAAVRVIRGIALGTLNEKTQGQFLNREFKMALSLSAVLSIAGFIRAIAFKTPLAETIAVTSALALIVFTSICFGAVLPILLKKIRIDPAHSSTSIQVIMDILGVVLTVLVSTTILDSPFGSLLVSKLSGKGGI